MTKPIEHVARLVDLQPGWYAPRCNETYEQYVDRVATSLSDGDPHFSAAELRRMRRARVTVPEPPSAWWPRIVPTLWLAEQLRKAMGPLIVGNGYRPEPYNRQVGGARFSSHKYHRAMDLDLPLGGDYESRRDFYALACRLWLEHGRDLGIGLGLYAPWGGSRVHVDTGRQRPTYWKKRYVRPILERLR